MGLYQVLCIYVIDVRLVFLGDGTPNSRSRCVFDSFAWSLDSSPLVKLPSPASVCGLLPCLVFGFVMFGCCPLEACFFSKGRGGEIREVA